MTCNELKESIEKLKSEILKLKWGRAVKDDDLRKNHLPKLQEEYQKKNKLYNYIMNEKQWEING